MAVSFVAYGDDVIGMYYRFEFWTKIVFHTVISSKRSRSSLPEVFFEKGVLKICSKFTGEHACRSAISMIYGVLL